MSQNGRQSLGCSYGEFRSDEVGTGREWHAAIRGRAAYMAWLSRASEGEIRAAMKKVFTVCVELSLKTGNRITVKQTYYGRSTEFSYWPSSAQLSKLRTLFVNGHAGWRVVREGYRVLFIRIVHDTAVIAEFVRRELVNDELR